MSEKRRDWGIFIDDILGSIEKLERYTEGKTFEEFSHNEIVIDAVIRNFEIIGEAARKIPVCGMEGDAWFQKHSHP